MLNPVVVVSFDNNETGANLGGGKYSLHSLLIYTSKLTKVVEAASHVVFILRWYKAALTGTAKAMRTLRQMKNRPFLLRLCNLKGNMTVTYVSLTKEMLSELRVLH